MTDADAPIVTDIRHEIARLKAELSQLVKLTSFLSRRANRIEALLPEPKDAPK